MVPAATSFLCSLLRSLLYSALDAHVSLLASRLSLFASRLSHLAWFARVVATTTRAATSEVVKGTLQTYSRRSRRSVCMACSAASPCRTECGSRSVDGVWRMPGLSSPLVHCPLALLPSCHRSTLLLHSVLILHTRPCSLFPLPHSVPQCSKTLRHSALHWNASRDMFRNASRDRIWSASRDISNSRDQHPHRATRILDLALRGLGLGHGRTHRILRIAHGPGKFGTEASR